MSGVDQRTGQCITVELSWVEFRLFEWNRIELNEGELNWIELNRVVKGGVYQRQQSSIESRWVATERLRYCS